MGNVIGLDFSYAEKSLEDKVYVSILCSSKEESDLITQGVSRYSILKTHNVQTSKYKKDPRFLHLLYINSREVVEASHLLLNYSSLIKKVALCGNKSTSVITTLESLLPDTVIYEFDHLSCVDKGIVMIPGLKDATAADEGNESITDHCLKKRHLHVTVHSGTTYQMADSDKEEVILLGNAPIGCSAVVTLYNMFLSKHGMDNHQVTTDFNTIVELASKGTAKSCDMLVSDIYGGDCEAIGLSGDIMAASFGKLAKCLEGSWDHKNGTKDSGRHGMAATDNPNGDKMDHPNHDTGDVPNIARRKTTPQLQNVPSKRDFAHSLIQMLVINVTHHAALHAQIHKVDSILFCGIFCRNDWINGLIEQFMGFWTRGSVSYVYRNSMYIAAMGATELAAEMPSNTAEST